MDKIMKLLYSKNQEDIVVGLYLLINNKIWDIPDIKSLNNRMWRLKTNHELLDAGRVIYKLTYMYCYIGSMDLIFFENPLIIPTFWEIITL